MIKIKGQPWLNNEQHPFITTESPAIKDKNVSFLSCMDGKEWDMGLVSDIFNERDQECILNTPLEESNIMDMVYWNNEQSGNYTV